MDDLPAARVGVERLRTMKVRTFHPRHRMLFDFEEPTATHC